ncbi:MAG: tRNA pseudouridine(55) synthase TruB [Deltaproteobacteria bacterium]|nr:tRNA pseudouridine(55) synthase TruB [Deltaproteobacteria bacterium]
MTTTKHPSGILILDKPAGMTSFDCIRKLKKIWNRSDLGHGGTLDKFATGLLPVLAGEGLKLARFFLESYPGLPTYWKTYTGTFALGTSTETGDPEGAVVETRDAGMLTVERVQAAMDSFTGHAYEQMPPRYSAKKIGGERASDLARAGIEAELKPSLVTIRRFRCLGIEGARVHFEAECSKGTYVRVLATDLARKLDTVGHVAELRRTAVGTFEIASAVKFEQLEGIAAAGLLDLNAATSFIPSLELISGELEQLRVGRTDLIATRLANSGRAPGIYCARTPAAPVALFELDAEKHASFLRAFV